MLHNLQTRKHRSGVAEGGFTIIEVLIVLAIAGLILLIVFLAVPALQRNAHNTSAKNDVASILGAMNEYVNNNGGRLPAAAAAGSLVANSDTATVVVGNGVVGVNPANAKLGYFTSDKVSIVTSVPAPFPSLGSVVIVEGAVCNNTDTAASTTGASMRNYVALYTLEGGAAECQAS